MSENNPPKDPQPQEPTSGQGTETDKKLPPPPPFQPDLDLITYIEKGRKTPGKKRSG